MKNEEYVAWNPPGLTLRPLNLLSLSDARGGLNIHLSDGLGKSQVVLSYPDGVLCYRNCDEGDRLKTLGLVPDIGNSLLYIVRNSSFVEWFLYQNYFSKFDRNKIKHISIFTIDNIIDIIDFEYPAVTISDVVAPEFV